MRAQQVNQYSLIRPVIRLVSYAPLCRNSFGRKAMQEYGLNPFIDSSCRREPDLDSKYPSITATCRAGKLAPVLNVNDILIYLAKYGGSYNMTAILKVIETLDTHEQGAKWYLGRGLKIPSNCIVTDNPPENYFATAGNFGPERDIRKFESLPEDRKLRLAEVKLRAWDSGYRSRVREYPRLNITEPIYLNTKNPITISPGELRSWFDNKIPGTQNPRKLKQEEYQHFLDLAG